MPTGFPLKLLGPAQAAVGLAILSAAISWILSIYGVLRTSRATARGIDLLVSSDRVDPPELAGITAQLVSLDIELRQFPIAYHFPSLDRRREISVALERWLELVQAPPLAGTPQAWRAKAAGDGLLAAVNERFLGAHRGSEQETLARWRADHLWAADESAEP